MGDGGGERGGEEGRGVVVFGSVGVVTVVWGCEGAGRATGVLTHTRHQQGKGNNMCISAKIACLQALEVLSNCCVVFHFLRGRSF